jgi:hypothetical protein
VKRRIVGIVTAMLLAASPALAECPPDAPLGVFKGANDAETSERIEVMLNLACADGRYLAEFYTSISDFPVTAVRASPAEVHLSFQVFGGPAQADLTLAGDTLAGPLAIPGAKGSLNLTRTGPPLAPGAMIPTLAITPAQWREDVDAFAADLPKRHANAFFHLSRAGFDGQVADLRRRLPGLNGDQVFVELERIANLIGDGHTGVVFPFDRQPMPLQFARFGDDLRVVAAGPGAERAIGARLVRIDAVPVAEAWRRALTLTPQDELPILREGRAVTYLRSGLLLHGLGITTDRTRARFTFRDDAGRTFSLDLAAAPEGQPAPSLTPAAPATGLARQNPDKAFWCQDLPDARAVYCDFRGYVGLGRGAAEMFDLLGKSHPAKLIIDMRDNGGGDNTVGYGFLVRPLKARADVNRKGSLYVLVGALTFSAAMNNAAQFQDETQATLVGQPIGEKPNSYQEPRQFRLPNSHLIVRASTLFYEFRKTGPNAVTPDKVITPTWADVKAGRDPVLDWVLAQPAS